MIATLNDKASLEIDIRVSRGKGYSSSSKNKRSDDVIGTIPVDSIFNPITNVSWEVESIPTSTESQERLIMEVHSNGATKPKDAMNHSANILRQQPFCKSMPQSLWTHLCSNQTSSASKTMSKSVLTSQAPACMTQGFLRIGSMSATL